jgi:hypothetical protein
VAPLRPLSSMWNRKAHPSARARRRLVKSLRLLAGRRPPAGAATRRFELLLHERVDLVRSDLVKIAILLEHDPDPDPACVAAVRKLLTDGCESPLYNPDVHPSELLATVYYVRSRLAAPVQASPVIDDS